MYLDVVGTNNYARVFQGISTEVRVLAPLISGSTMLTTRGYTPLQVSRPKMTSLAARISTHQLAHP
jgi:hypothetical protein